MAGCVPVVLNNPTERYIVKHLETGMIAETLIDYSSAIEYLYNNPNELKRMSENAKIFAKKQYNIRRTMKEWDNIFDKIMEKNKEERVWNKNQTEKISPAALYAESMGDKGEPFLKYLHAKNEFEKHRYGREIKKLFNTNSMFHSKNKGSVLQYLQFFQNDKYLIEWSKLLD